MVENDVRDGTRNLIKEKYYENLSGKNNVNKNSPKNNNSPTNIKNNSSIIIK
jgi:hypothetical protein